MEINEYRKKILGDSNYLLIEGGPGSGKTTIALLKAKKVIEDKQINKEQKVLFLSFARATILRVVDQARNLNLKQFSQSLDIMTYHSFQWNILNHHGYLINGQRLKILTPEEKRIQLATVPPTLHKKHLDLLFRTDGWIDFDSFSERTIQLLKGNSSLLSILCSKYPIIFLDEFQDTNDTEWELIKLLGSQSTLIALADSNQMIYSFRGATVKRIPQFSVNFSPGVYSFQRENNRSVGTDISNFSYDILNGENVNSTYSDVRLIKYPPYDSFSEIYYLKSMVLQSIFKHVQDEKVDNFSIGILVPDNFLVNKVSSLLIESQTGIFSGNFKELPKFPHKAHLDVEGIYLASKLMSYFLDSSITKNCKTFLNEINRYLLGSKKNISKKNLKIVSQINAYSDTGKTMTKYIPLIIKTFNEILKITESSLTGVLKDDWKTITDILYQSGNQILISVAKDASLFNYFSSDSNLSADIVKLWDENQSYKNLYCVIDNFISTLYLDVNIEALSGINIMNLHKSKGKEFDYVIMMEEKYHSFANPKNSMEETRRNLHVASSRARRKLFILTPRIESDIVIF